MFDKKMLKQKNLVGLGKASKLKKPLKWHYLLSKYLSHVMQGNVP